jgi:hypothetical protein
MARDVIHIGQRTYEAVADAMDARAMAQQPEVRPPLDKVTCIGCRQTVPNVDIPTARRLGWIETDRGWADSPACVVEYNRMARHQDLPPATPVAEQAPKSHEFTTVNDVSPLKISHVKDDPSANAHEVIVTCGWCGTRIGGGFTAPSKVTGRGKDGKPLSTPEVTREQVVATYVRLGQVIQTPQGNFDSMACAQRAAARRPAPVAPVTVMPYPTTPAAQSQLRNETLSRLAELRANNMAREVPDAKPRKGPGR